MQCNNDNACEEAKVYCPYREDKTCKISCSEDSYSCYNMQIYVPEKYKYGYLELMCPSAVTYPSSNGCWGLDVNCIPPNTFKSSQAVAIVYNATIDDYECRQDSFTYCCPEFKGTMYICQSAQNCIIDCTSSSSINCAETGVIDATDASYLTLDCGRYKSKLSIDYDGIDCGGTAIYCPIAGCSINCIGEESCLSLKVIYNGELTDNGVISVNCVGDSACHGAIFYVDYVHEFHISCTSTSNISRFAPCDITLLANYANKVVINNYEQYASWYATLNVTNAKNVIMSSYGPCMYSLRALIIQLFKNKNIYRFIVLQFISCRECRISDNIIRFRF